MRIVIETIPHCDHRYPTVGDWFYTPDGTLHIKVSQLSDWRREALIAVHELVEVLLCKHDGISTEQVDAFDKKFEAERLPDDNSEPGDESDAPYRKQHCIATGIERVLAANLDVDWKAYEQELSNLPEVETKR